jgi:hypothetical protein
MRPTPLGGLPHNSSCDECAGTTRREKKRTRRETSAQDGLRGLPRTLPGLASSPAGAPSQHKTTSHTSNDCRCALLCSLEITSLGQGRRTAAVTPPLVRRFLVTDPAGCRPALGASATRLATRWASVGAWHLPDICISNRRPRTWRERCKAAPLGCGLLCERLGGAPAFGPRAPADVVLGTQGRKEDRLLWRAMASAGHAARGVGKPVRRGPKPITISPQGRSRAPSRPEQAPQGPAARR